MEAVDNAKVNGLGRAAIAADGDEDQAENAAHNVNDVLGDSG